VYEIRVVATEFSFAPNRVEVPAGASVRLTFVNRGWSPHDFVIEGIPDVHLNARPGRSVSTTFTASVSGTRPFLCTLPGHSVAGMKGSLVVVEPVQPIDGIVQ
jgi:plastocyanin